MLALGDEQLRLVNFLISGHRIVDEQILRHTTDLPRWFLSTYNTVGIASDEFLQEADYQAGVQPEGWQSDRSGVFWKPVGSWDTLLVRACGDLWTIERKRAYEETLFSGGRIICARNRDAAMRLAEYCHPLPDGLCVGLQWIETT
jgi:hypothetical protein